MTIKIVAAVCALQLMSAATAGAQEITSGVWEVPAGKTMRIDEHGVCRMVTNKGASDAMVPTGAAAEWSSGSASFLQNMNDMDRVTAAPCPPWWESRKLYLGTVSRNPKEAEVSNQGSLVHTWLDGTTTQISAVGGATQPGTQMGALLPAKYYDNDTGACSPRKSWIMTGPFAVLGTSGPMPRHSVYIMFCESDGIASAPFINVKVAKDRTEANWANGVFEYVTQNVASFGSP